MTITLYEQDFNLWCEDTLHKIKVQDYDCIDWENLLEEIAGLAGRDRRELLSRLTTLYEHLLKRYYLNIPNNYRGWEVTVRRTQLAIKNILRDSPSLVSFLTAKQSECFADAYEIVKREYKKWQLPSANPFPQDIQQLLSVDILPDDDKP